MKSDQPPVIGGGASGSPPESGDREGDPYIVPGLINIISDDRSDNTGAPGPDRRAHRIEGPNPLGAGHSRRDIKDPDPDLAGFPNSAFTLPEGRLYIESDPFAYSTPSKYRNLKFNTDFLIRYGLTDSLELRLFGDGFVYRRTHPMPGPSGRPLGNSSSTTGFAPLAFDLKAHLWDENRKYFVPAAALEVYIQTALGSPAFDAGTQPSVNLNFDNRLPGDFMFEWNVGITGNRNGRGQTYYQSSFQWSLQHNVIGNFDAYLQGFVNDAGLPRLGASGSMGSPGSAPVVGIGGIWTATKRLAIFGSYNFGLAPQAYSHIALLGCAVAF